MSFDSRSEAKLKQLAKDDPHRQEVMRGRLSRYKTRDRRVTCPMCLDVSYSCRDAMEVCGTCLLEKWEAQDAAKRAADKESGNNYVVARTTSRYWDYPYPRLGRGKFQIQDDAIFKQEGEREDNAERVLQILFHKIVVGLGRAYPVPEPMRKDPVTFMATNYDGDIYALLPNDVYAALRQLWHLIEWIALEAERQAFERGTDLLGGMVKGEITADMFDKMTQEQTARIRETRKRVEEGNINR